MSNTLSSKLPHVGTTIFTEMSALAAEHNAINLSQGFPGFAIDSDLHKSVTKYMKKGYNQYAPMPGVKTLRKTLSNLFKSNYNATYNSETEITITAGATQAIYTAITSLIKENDEVIMFCPAYDCYAPAIQLNGGVCKYVNLYYPDYKINWQIVKKLITNKTRLIIINNPHNPTGAILTKEDINELEKITQNNNIFVLSDEVYEHIVFDNEKHQSVTNSTILKEKSFVTYSFGKSLHATGWKMGFCLAPAFLMKEFRKVHQFNVFSCNTPVQYAINDYVENNNPFQNIASFYQQKRDLFIENLKNSRFEIVPSKSTYFQLLSYKKITNKNNVEFAKELTIKNKVASIPTSVFYNDKTDEKVLRFCFAKEEKELLEATKILCKI